MRLISATSLAASAAMFFAATVTAQESFPLGEPRDDLERFYGLYGDPNDDDGRSFFVTKAEQPIWAEQATPIPEGYIMIGAMWGDAAPWFLRSLSETRFEQQWVMDGIEPIVIEFELDQNGNPAAVIFETVFADRGRLERLGDLPEGF